jgi:hypothetical protein
MNTYAALIENNTVTQVIVGTAEWAQSRLGGQWVNTETLVGIGWDYVDNQFVAPIVEEGEDDTLLGG